MRFISRSEGLRIEAIPQEWDTLANGQIREIKSGIMVEFRNGFLHPWEKDAARANFNYPTRETDLTSGEKIDWVEDNRVGVFDSLAAQESYVWSDELRKTVENNLLKALDIRPGLRSDYMVVPRPVLAKPWPSYDETDHNRVAEMTQAMGLEKDSVIAYERDNKNRPSVITALEEIEEPTTVSA
jgi:hypothetical protein